MTKDKVRKFWSDRAKVTQLPRLESQVNFENDKSLADLRVKAETALIEEKLQLDKSDIVVDLGAGNGRFSLLFAPKVKKVIAVEYINDFTSSIKQQAKKLQLNNIEVLNIPAEEFCLDDCADVVFVSGLLHYLDTEQYSQTVGNIFKTLKSGGVLFLRETISVLDNEFIVDKFSDELGAHYCSIYRTSHQHTESFDRQGFTLNECSPFFEDGSIINKRTETRLYYFLFKKCKDSTLK
jgi:precorrin-6B methylase 2